MVLLLSALYCVESDAAIVCPAPADYEPCVCADSGDGLTTELQCRNMNLTDAMASAILDAFSSNADTISPLSRLDMSLNALTKVPDQIASSLHQLVYANLPNNQIQSLPTGAFNFVSTSAMLDVVFLNNNQMTSIESGAFQGSIPTIIIRALTKVGVQ